MPRNELSVRANPLAGSQQNSLGRKILNALIYGPSEALPMEGRYNLLPLRQTDWPLKGDTEWALPGIAAGMVNAFTAPGRAIEGKIAPSQMVPEAMNFAGNVGLDSWALSRAMQDPTRAVPNSTDVAAMVYHGSPHRFPPMKLIEMPDGTRLYQNMLERPEIISGAKVIEDFPLGRFDSSKIGTGEGAQAYGHGLYFAEHPDVARQYQVQTSGDLFSVGDGSVFDPSTLGHLNVRTAVRGGDLDAAIAKAAKIAASDSPVANVAAQDLATLQGLKARGGITKNPGAFYHVDIPDEHIAKMLDWDKPLSQQSPEVRKALETLGYRHDAAAANAFDDALLNALNGSGPATLPKQPIDPLGADIYRKLASKAGSTWLDPNINAAAQVSNRLRELGIPGIRYLDAGSRGSGQGTSNYALFDDSLAKILKRE